MITLKGQKAFINVEIFPVLVFFQLLVILIFFGIMIAFDASVYLEWTRYTNIQEARAELNNIANDLDYCLAHGKDTKACDLEIIDKQNMPFLMSSYQSPHFRYDINPHFHDRSFCVINAVKVDAKRNPIYSSKDYPQDPFGCGGFHILPFNHASGIVLCRDQYGSRTFYGFGTYQFL